MLNFKSAKDDGNYPGEPTDKLFMQEKYGFDFKKEKDKDPETHQKSLQIWEKDQNKRY